VFKSAEEKEAERRERDAEQARVAEARAEQERQQAEARRRAEWLATPVGMASAAKEAGQTFIELQLEVGGHLGTADFGSARGQRSQRSSAAILAEVEQVGWRLEHAGYFFMVTGESSTERMFLSGQNTAVSGVTVGVYLFRNTDSPASAPVADDH
jgi:hypothetical protein